jgi:hypothetical protein
MRDLRAFFAADRDQAKRRRGKRTPDSCRLRGGAAPASQKQMNWVRTSHTFPGLEHPNVKKEPGQQFIDYLVSPEGQRDIANCKIDGAQLFYPNADDPGA